MSILFGVLLLGATAIGPIGNDDHLNTVAFEFIKPGVTRAEVDKRLGEPYVSSISVVIANHIDLFVDEAPSADASPAKIAQPTENVHYYEYRPDKFPSEYARIVFRKGKVWYAMLPLRPSEMSVDKAEQRYGKKFIASKLQKKAGHLLSVMNIYRLPDKGVGLVEVPGRGMTHRLVFPPEK